MRTLVGDHDWYGPGSRIIVTGRDKLIQKVDVIYEIKGLNNVDALQLFSLQAFKQSLPDQSYAEVIELAVNYAKGVPLALKVLGSLLYNKPPREWKSKLDMLKMFPESQIHKVLQISYNELNECEKNIFLDIACFFKGEDKDLVEDVLDGCEFFAKFGISRLYDMCLVTIIDNKLQMHDLLQEMGWDIVRKESKEYGKRTRLWNPEEILHASTNDMGTELIEGMVLNLSKVHEAHIHPLAFSRMHNLRILKFYYGGIDLLQGTRCGLIFENNCLQYLPHNLRFLYWDRYPRKSLPYDFSPEKLVHLSIKFGNIERLWVGDKLISQLKQLDLTFSENLVSLPDLSSAINLEKIILDYCFKLLEIPTSIQFLKKLGHLSLFCCRSLRSLPEIPANVKELYLDHTDLVELPSSIGNLSSPLELHLRQTSIKELPSSIGGLSSLVKLDLSETLLEELPSSIGGLSSLVELNLHGTLLEELPSSIGGLSSLVELDLSRTLLEELPSSIGGLSSLVIMKLKYCKRLRTLPSSICELKCLKELNLSYSGIHELPCSFGHLYALQRLYLKECNLQSIDMGIKQLSLLQIIDLSGCNGLESLPELPCLVSYVDATNCKSLTKVSCSSINFALTSWPNCSFIFTNCINLDKSARANIMSFLRIDQDVETTLRKFSTTSKYPGEPKCIVCLPESKIPDWFQHQSMGAQIHVSLPTSFCRLSSIGLALGALVEFPDYHDNEGDLFQIGCKCNFTNHKGDVFRLFSSMDASALGGFDCRFETDHVFIWFVRDFCASNDTEEGCLRDLSFWFYASDGSNDLKIKMCGVHIVCFGNEDECIAASNKPSSCHESEQLLCADSVKKRKRFDM